MKVKIKKLSDKAVIPFYSNPGDAGMDITATRKWTDVYGNICYGTDLAFEIPEGYVMLIFPRSSVSRYDLSLCNSVGVLDSSYRGELIFKFTPSLFVGNTNDEETDNEEWDLNNGETFTAIPGRNPYIPDYILNWDFNVYDVGDKIGQIIIMPYPQIEFEEVNELSETKRGKGGFGSTGK